jgi:peptide-methionine (S)-S-oxide reductase
MEKIVLGGGCFWCLEPLFKQLQGVEEVTMGYTGGHKPFPAYQEVCTGNTGHAEVVEVKYDPAQISLEDLLNIFFQVHDPTTLNQQGFDIGTQYRSVVFVNGDDEKKLVEGMISKINQSKVWKNQVVTQVEYLTDFYPAEEYHQDYFAKNPHAGYCQFVVRPKVERFENKFFTRLKN